MKKFQIYREDINKVVLKSIDAIDQDDAAGKYISVLMLAGMVKMTGKAVEFLKENVFQVNKADGKSFEIIITEINI